MAGSGAPRQRRVKSDPSRRGWFDATQDQISADVDSPKVAVRPYALSGGGVGRWSMSLAELILSLVLWALALFLGYRWFLSDDD